MNGQCETDCLTFEEKIGTCRANGTPLCCRERKKHWILSTTNYEQNLRRTSLDCPSLASSSVLDSVKSGLFSVWYSRIWPSWGWPSVWLHCPVNNVYKLSHSLWIVPFADKRKKTIKTGKMEVLASDSDKLPSLVLSLALSSSVTRSLPKFLIPVNRRNLTLTVNGLSARHRHLQQ